MQIRKVIEPLFADEDFVDLLLRRGQPAWQPEQLAIMSVLQSVEGLSDRQAAAAEPPWLEWRLRTTVSMGAGRSGAS